MARTNTGIETENNSLIATFMGFVNNKGDAEADDTIADPIRKAESGDVQDFEKRMRDVTYSAKSARDLQAIENDGKNRPSNNGVKTYNQIISKEQTLEGNKTDKGYDRER